MPNAEKIEELRLVLKMIGFVPNCFVLMLEVGIVSPIDRRPKDQDVEMERFVSMENVLSNMKIQLITKAMDS